MALRGCILADYRAIYDVGDSIVTTLKNAMPSSLGSKVSLISSKLLSTATPSDLEPGLTLCLYRTTINEHTRNRRPIHQPDAQPALSLELHYMLTAWANDAEKEHHLLAWAMAQLHRSPILDQSTLKPNPTWAPDEAIHIVPLDLPIEDTMRIWDAWAPTYRLSVCYAARVVHIDVEDHAPVRVTTRRIGVGETDRTPEST